MTDLLLLPGDGIGPEVTAQVRRVAEALTPDLVIDERLPLPPLMADPTQVEQALFNLCNNAMQAMGEARGFIQIQAQLQRPEPHICDRLGLPYANYLVLAVQDNGPGMDVVTQQRIFEPFFTTKSVGQGTGLGLSVVHGVMRTHGGAVDVFSVPGQGSRFSLYLPVARHMASLPPAPSAAPPSFAPLEQTRALKVLVLDDDERIVEATTALLERLGHQAIGVHSPAQAQAIEGAIDAALVDYQLGAAETGLDVIASLRIRQPDLPAMLASHRPHGNAVSSSKWKR